MNNKMDNKYIYKIEGKTDNKSIQYCHYNIYHDIYYQVHKIRDDYLIKDYLSKNTIKKLVDFL